MLRRLRGRFGISARRVAISTHIPWYWRAGATVVLLALVLVLSVWIYDTGRNFSGFDSGQSEQKLRDLHARISQLEEELASLHNLASASESKLQIERTAQQELAQQIKRLEVDNGRLREDLAVFENLAAGETKTSGIGIQRLQVAPEATKGSYRYRMLLSAPILSKGKEFQGQLQLVVTVMNSGKTVILTFPQAGEPDAQKYLVKFKHFRRVEGVFQVPADTLAKMVEARLLQNGIVVATQQASL